MTERTAKCAWSQDGDYDGDMWATGCGNYFILTDGTPAENDMRFCCYCGKSLETIPYEEDEE